MRTAATVTLYFLLCCTFFSLIFPKFVFLLITGIVFFHSWVFCSRQFSNIGSSTFVLCLLSIGYKNLANKSSTFEPQMTKLSALMVYCGGQKCRHTVQNLLKCGNCHPPLQTKRRKDNNAKNTTFH